MCICAWVCVCQAVMMMSSSSVCADLARGDWAVEMSASRLVVRCHLCV